MLRAIVRGSRWLFQTGVTRPRNSLGAVGYLELAEDVGDVVLHGLEAKGEVPRDGSVTLALRDQVEDLPLAFGEVGEGDGRGGLRQSGEVMDHALGDGRAEDGLTTIDGFDCPHQFVLIGIFEQV